MATNLGLSRDHPLAGWKILTILYHDGSSSNEAMTLKFLLNRYNTSYLDSEDGETPVTDQTLRHVLTTLSDQANLIGHSTKKIRIKTKNGNYNLRQSIIYHITGSGIEYLNLMQKVVDAENTVTSNINQINEYCRLIDILSDIGIDLNSTQLYNDFSNMIKTYDDVMKGMHKLDEDLNNLANDINFNHGSQAAKHLQSMINDKAIPAFRRILNKAPRVQSLANSSSFKNKIAHSQQRDDDLDTSHAINDKNAMTKRFRQTEAYVKRQMDRIAKSLDPSTSAIDNSLDSVYLLFNTIIKAIQLLSQEYDHITKQNIDLKALTAKIDELLINYQSLSVPAKIQRHYAQDRPLDNPSDLLEASIMGPVVYQANTKIKKIATEEDNPLIVANDQTDEISNKNALIEIKSLIMKDDNHAVIDHDLEFQTKIARDEVIRIYSATNHDDYDSFTPFGRTVDSVDIIPNCGKIRLHCSDEKFSVYLPQGFKINFRERKTLNG